MGAFQSSCTIAFVSSVWWLLEGLSSMSVGEAPWGKLAILGAKQVMLDWWEIILVNIQHTIREQEEFAAFLLLHLQMWGQHRRKSLLLRLLVGWVRSQSTFSSKDSQNLEEHVNSLSPYLWRTTTSVCHFWIRSSLFIESSLLNFDRFLEQHQDQNLGMILIEDTCHHRYCVSSLKR